MPPPMPSPSTAPEWKLTSIATETLRPAACPLHSTNRSAPAASVAATCCSSAASAAASPGAPHLCDGSPLSVVRCALLRTSNNNGRLTTDIHDAQATNPKTACPKQGETG